MTFVDLPTRLVSNHRHRLKPWPSTPPSIFIHIPSSSGSWINIRDISKTGTERTRRYAAVALEAVGRRISSDTALDRATFASNPNELVVAEIAEYSGPPLPKAVRDAELAGIGELYKLMLTHEPAQLKGTFHTATDMPARWQVLVTEPPPAIQEPISRRPNDTCFDDEHDPLKTYRIRWKPMRGVAPRVGDGWDLMHAAIMIQRGIQDLQKMKSMGQSECQHLLYYSPGYDLVWDYRVLNRQVGKIDIQIQALIILLATIKLYGINSDEYSLYYLRTRMGCGTFQFNLPQQVEGNLTWVSVDGTQEGLAPESSVSTFRR